MNDKKAFLGRGWSFPPVFDSATGEVALSEAEQDIKESLWILLTTRVGERLMQPGYGCNLDDYVFESVDRTFLTLVYELVETAILYFEPRIKLENVLLRQQTPQEGMIEIEVIYRVKSTNSRSNLVFPFYKTEGSDR